MFNMFKMTIVLALMAGIIFLGAGIHRKSNDMDNQLATKKDEIKAKISEIKKTVLDKTADLHANGDPANKNPVHLEASEKAAPESKKSAPAETFKAQPPGMNENLTDRVRLDPVDAEDRELTQEILSENAASSSQSEKALEITEIYNAATSSQVPMGTDEITAPIDLNRVAEIQNLYVRAVEALDFK